MTDELEDRVNRLEAKNAELVELVQVLLSTVKALTQPQRYHGSVTTGCTNPASDILDLELTTKASTRAPSRT